MVDQEKISHLITNQNNMSWEEVAWLENMSKKYPYFQSLKTLIAKHYLLEDHLLKSHKIHSASVSACDRNILRKRLLLSSKIDTPESKTQKHTPETVVIVPPEEPLGHITKPIAAVKPEEKSREELLKAVQDRLAELQKNKEKISEEVKKIKSVSEQKTKPNALPKNHITEETTKPSAPLEKTIEKSNIRKEKIAETKRLKQEIAKKETDLKAEIEKKQEFKNLFYSRLGNELNIDNTDSIDLLLNYLDNQKEKKKKAEHKETKIDSIVEKFIQNEPKIGKIDLKSKENQEDLTQSKYSQTKFISENLAKIQASQGHIKDAIDIYKELMLKYPEKKSYFANEIKKLK